MNTDRQLFDVWLNREWRRSARFGRTISLLLVAVDAFTTYKDIYGKAAGIALLENLAARLDDIPSRPGDLFAQYRQDVFGVILPETSAQGAATVAEQMLIEAHQCDVTISVGVATVKHVPSETTPLVLMNAAEQALYQAQSMGGDRLYVLSA